jgi:hypothetical protein
MHLRDVERFLHGHHLTINVRNEDEIDMADILQKVSKVTASAFNFKEKPQGMEHSPKPVGTAHKKINPTAELPGAEEREKFWSADQDDEKRRLEAERQRREEEQRRVEQERRQREEAEGRLRETQIKERERKISSLREAELESVEKDKDSQERSRWQRQQVRDAQGADPPPPPTGIGKRYSQTNHNHIKSMSSSALAPM